MNIIFITLSTFNDINNRGIYTDLLREFVHNGHDVYIVRPTERRLGQPTSISENGKVHILSVRTLNIQKTHVIEKGIGTVLLEYQFLRAVKRYYRNVKFDLILYSTPPITIVKVIKSLKKQSGATTYLMLKDIFPQNAVDMDMFSKNGILYRLFRGKEKQMYAISDYIGCTSPANIDFVVNHNSNVSIKKMEICTNAMEIVEQQNIDVVEIKDKYGIPQDKRVFVYGGNLGKPQGIDFLIEVLDANKYDDKLFFLIVGSGTEAHKIEKWVAENRPQNTKYLHALPRVDYDNLVRACDVGLIFLDHRFTIPNYPSRLLAYLNNRMPVLIASDPNTDIGKIATENGYGMWTESNNLARFNVLLDKYVSMSTEELAEMGQRGYDFMVANYDVRNAYRTIISHINNVPSFF